LSLRNEKGTPARNHKSATSGTDLVIEVIFENCNLSTIKQVFGGGRDEHHI